MDNLKIAVVRKSIIRLEDTALEFESPEGKQWLSEARSFRYESVAGHKAFTARKQTIDGADYWYGSRKINGKLHKKYISNPNGLTLEKLEGVAAYLTQPSREKPQIQTNTDTAETMLTDRIKTLETRLSNVEELLQRIVADLKTT